MSDLDRKIDEILKVEETSARAREEMKQRVKEILKEAALEREKILEDAALAVRKEGEGILQGARREAEREVKKMLLDAEILAKKNRIGLEQKKAQIFKFLFQNVFE